MEKQVNENKKQTNKQIKITKKKLKVLRKLKNVPLKCKNQVLFGGGYTKYKVKKLFSATSPLIKFIDAIKNF